MMVGHGLCLRIVWLLVVECKRLCCLLVESHVFERVNKAQ